MTAGFGKAVVFKIAIFGAFLLAGAQWLTGDEGKRSRTGGWLLFGLGVALAAIYVALSLEGP